MEQVQSIAADFDQAKAMLELNHKIPDAIDRHQIVVHRARVDQPVHSKGLRQRIARQFEYPHQPIVSIHLAIEHFGKNCDTPELKSKLQRRQLKNTNGKQILSMNVSQTSK